MNTRQRVLFRSKNSKIASIDFSNAHLNEDKYNPPTKSVSSQHIKAELQKTASSTQSIELNFNSDETLTGSQSTSQFFSSNNINAVGDSNATIQDTQEEEDVVDELENSVNKLSFQDPPASISTNLQNQKSSSHLLSSTPKSIELRRPKTALRESSILSNEFSSESKSNSNSPSISRRTPLSQQSSLYPVNDSTEKRAPSFTFSNNEFPRRRKGAMSLKCYMTMEDDIIEEDCDEEDESKWEINFNDEEAEASTTPPTSPPTTSIPRKPKSLFNESVYSYSSSVNQIRNDLKMEKYRTKKRYFSNILSRDYDFFLRDKLKTKFEELNSNNNPLQKVSSSRAHSIKETDSIYLKSDEPGNVPSLHCMTEGKVNQYYFIKEIDSGSYGRVYMVYDENINEYFACKVISKSRLKRNFRFAQVARRRNITPSFNGEVVQKDESDPLD